jgi:hypothetical protein
VVLLNADPAEGELFLLEGEYVPGFPKLIPPRYRAVGAWPSSGVWDERHHDLRYRSELHLGYYVAVAEVS